MLKQLSIAGSLALFVTLLSMLMAASTIGYLVYKERQAITNQVIDGSVSLAKIGSHEIQLALYYNDETSLTNIADSFFESTPVSYTEIYDTANHKVIARNRPGHPARTLPEFNTARKSFSLLSQGLSSYMDAPSGEKYFDLSIPIFSVVPPSSSRLTRDDFYRALASSSTATSLHLIGYFRVGISQSIIDDQVYSFSIGIIAAGLAFVLISALTTMLLSRRLTAPLSRLATIALDIADGKIDTRFITKGSGEAHQIASMLNLIIDGLGEFKTKMSVNNILLTMKVDERTSELSSRNKELNDAVQEITQAQQRLHQLAYFDSLTSLPNRRLFTEQLNLLLRTSQRDKKLVALIFLDLDNFKRVNDSLGHGAGDILLKKVSSRLVECVRLSDLISRHLDETSKIGVSRLGGDEFTIVLTNLDSPESVSTVAERILGAFSSPIKINDHELVVTPSIGIAIAPHDGQDVETLLRNADTAMYHAKSAGKNNYRYYLSSMKGSGIERLKLETELRRAIERKELVLHYQPQVDIYSGKIVGAEAMVRWNHPELGLVPPMAFIPLAEEMGLIRSLGDWVVEEACRQMKRFRDARLNLPKISVNVSSLQFNQEFVAHIAQLLKQNQLAPETLELELTEGIIMGNAHASVKTLQDLKELGVSLSVDDFGTGYSSLTYLSRFPLDELKIDRSFVVDLDKGERNQSLVMAIIAMGSSLHLRLVAEGVETVDQYWFLKNHGVKIIQGYIFSKPVPADEFSEMLMYNNFLEMIHSFGNSNQYPMSEASGRATTSQAIDAQSAGSTAHKLT